MSFAAPYTLLLLLPALGALIWLRTRCHTRPARLPGDWPRIIEPSLQSFMARYGVSESRPPLLLLSIWISLVLALAQPGIDTGETSDYANLAGRVIVLDLGAGADIRHQRLAVLRLIKDAPDVPTAIVVATSEAFDAVPMTTDHGHLKRYLQVIKADVMPVGGRSLALAAAYGDALLTRAAIVVGQVVVISGGTPPERHTMPPPRWPRAVVIIGGNLSAWRTYGEKVKVQLTDVDGLAPLSYDLKRDIARAHRQGDRLARRDLAPWLTGTALVLWLMLFRRRSTS